jgi:hypothetical protein
MLGRRREDLPVDIETGANGLCLMRNRDTLRVIYEGHPDSQQVRD